MKFSFRAQGLVPQAQVVPSLDLVVYKLGGATVQYDPAATGVRPPQRFGEQDASRDGWKPAAGGPFEEAAASYTLPRVPDQGSPSLRGVV